MTEKAEGGREGMKVWSGRWGGGGVKEEGRGDGIGTCIFFPAA